MYKAENILVRTPANKPQLQNSLLSQNAKFFLSTFQSNLEIWENAINRNKNNSRLLFFHSSLPFSLCYTLCPELWPLLSFSCCSAPKKHNCDLHCPKNNNNNNINLAAELLQSGYHRAQRTAPVRNSTAEICLSYFSTNRAIPSVTYYNMNNQTWQMEHKYTKTTMLKLTVKHLLLFNITTWHATLGTQTVGTNWQLDSNLKKHPLKKVVSACCCPSSWTQLWTWEQCLIFFPQLLALKRHVMFWLRASNWEQPGWRHERIDAPGRFWQTVVCPDRNLAFPAREGKQAVDWKIFYNSIDTCAGWRDWPVLGLYLWSSAAIFYIGFPTETLGLNVVYVLCYCILFVALGR